MNTKRTQALLFFTVSLIAILSVLYLPILQTKFISADQIKISIEEQFITDDLEIEHLIENLKNELKSGDSSTITDLIVKINPTIYGLFIYHDSKPVYWSKIDIPYRYRAGTDRTVIKLSNGYYYLRQFKLSGEYECAVLRPVKYNYPIENRYLRNEWVYGDYQKNLSLSLDDPGSGTPIFHGSGNPLFYIMGFATHSSKSSIYISIALLLISFIFMLTGIQWLVFAIKKGFGFLISVIAFTAFLALFKFIIVVWIQPGLPIGIGLFDPGYYASSDLAASLGDLFINVFFFFWISIYVFINLNLVEIKQFKGVWGLYIIFICIIYGTGFLILEIAESLIIDSRISFDLNNFFSLDIYSLIGLICLAMMMTGWFLISFRLAEAVSNRYKGFLKWISGILAGMGIIFLIGYFSGFYQDILISLIAGTCLLLILRIQIPNKISPGSFWLVIVWVCFFSLLTAIYLNRFNNIKENDSRKLMASSLIQEDYLSGFFLKQNIPEIRKDPLVKGFFLNPVISKRQLSDRLDYLYFKGQLSKYDIKVNTYLRDDIPYRNNNDKRVNDYFKEIDSASVPSQIQGLYFFPESRERLEYLAMIKIYRNPSGESPEQIGRLIIEFKTKSYSISTLYPELLIDETYYSQPGKGKFSWALYSNNVLIKKEGDYPYKLNYHQLNNQVYSETVDGDFHHLIYNIRPGKSIWISSEKLGAFEPLSLFSFIFFIYLVLVILAQVSLYILDWLSGNREPLQLPFTVKIQYTVMLVIMLSFVVIGSLIITNTNRQYEEYHTSRLIRKSKQIMSGIDYLRHQSQTYGSSQDWDGFFNREDAVLDIINLSEIHSMDINVYSPEGGLMVSSQPEIFGKGLISEFINPLSKHKILNEYNSQFIQTEHIGGLNYLSAYMPLIDSENNLKAIINLPYYAKERDLKEEISNFLLYFINIYVLLFVLAGMFGLVISNSITRPISVLGGKLKAIQLGKPNEQLVWKNRDEIGQLIGEYNKMIQELEKSARLLAQSERESAWRDMAKQVAHEIKNPLTPMKLSIQHLQRATSGTQEETKEKIAQVSKTLIEQIENLSRIASEFSSFAKLPEAHPENLDLNSLLKSVADLFKNEDVELVCSLPEKVYYVNADKSQMIRVFNNIIKNAVQAIPDERAGEIFIGLKNDNGTVTVKVEDNGVGIPKSEWDKVFVPNFTTKSSGSGIGLAMTKKIIELLNGKIWFDSKPGQGSVFYISIPAYKDPQD